jgi:adenosylmethionine-8-amino-7-oxononanoate aminotransferase
MDGDHILVCPPLIVTDPQLDEIAEMLDLSLTRFIEEVRPSLPRSA